MQASAQSSSSLHLSLTTRFVRTALCTGNQPKNLPPACCLPLRRQLPSLASLICPSQRKGRELGTLSHWKPLEDQAFRHTTHEPPPMVLPYACQGPTTWSLYFAALPTTFLLLRCMRIQSSSQKFITESESYSNLIPSRHSSLTIRNS